MDRIRARTTRPSTPRFAFRVAAVAPAYERSAAEHAQRAAAAGHGDAAISHLTDAYRLSRRGRRLGDPVEDAVNRPYQPGTLKGLAQLLGARGQS